MAEVTSTPPSPREAVPAGPALYLRLRAAVFDPLAGEPSLPDRLRRLTLGGDRLGLRLVQFSGPIREEWYEAMEKASLSVVTYIPDYAYLVWGDGAAMENLRSLAPLRWASLYHPAYALHPALADSATLPAEVEVIVQVYDHPDAETTVRAIIDQALDVFRRPYSVLVYRNIGVRVSSDDLTWLASLPDVVNVEPYHRPRLLDEVQGQIIAGNLNGAGSQPSGPGYLAWLQGFGFSTNPNDYPIVDVTDDGIDDGDATPIHADFYTLGSTSNPDRLVYNYNWTSDPLADGGGGHGNINASIVAGYNNRTGFPYEDGNGYNYGLGINPFGRVAGSKVFNNAGEWDTTASPTQLINNSYLLEARISSNSWGCGYPLCWGSYDAEAQEYDRLVRDARPSVTGNQEITIIFAAGNDGQYGSGTVGTPGTAKNVITVGAAENYRPTGTDGCGVGPTGADNAQDIASFSSRGPCDDSRVKPDIVAPGTHIQGAASQSPNYDGSGVCNKYWPSGQTLYAWSSGTSHSTPAVAGAASLVYYWYQTHYGNGQPPSPAMIKAYLINAARYLTGNGASGNLPSNSQGFGEVNLGMAFDSTPRIVLDQARLFGSTGQTYRLDGVVADSGKPFRVTLAWTDAPGPTTGNAYVNNLDLAVTVGGQTYRGNVFSGPTSVAGGSADPRNNVESVFLPAGLSGPFTVVITATNIAGDGVPGNGDSTDQDFALVVYNAAYEPTGVLRGVVSEAGSGSPIVGARVEATASLTQTGAASSGAGGVYSMSLPAATYVVTASAFGYLPSTATGVVVTAGVTITQNFSLTPVPSHIVSGVVSDATAGWPLYAGLDITNSTGYAARIWTNPVTGFYSTTLPEGAPFYFRVNAWVAGYNPLTRTVGPLTSNRTENFTLTVDASACSAPGYSESSNGCFPRPGGLAVGNVYDEGGAPRAGATVANDAGYSTTTAFTEDPTVDDSFYTLFSPAGSHVFTATLNGYGAAITTTNVVQSNTVRLDFRLVVPRLSYTPASITAVLTRGLSTTLPLTLTNTGGLTLTFELQEWSGAGTTLLSEGFESGQVPPSGWSEVIRNSAANWKALSTGAHTGAYAATVEPSAQYQDEWLLTSEMNLVTATLSFWSFGDPSRCRDAYNNCDLFVWIVGGDVGGLDDVYVGRADDVWSTNRVWRQSTFNLTSLLPDGPVRIGFQYVGQNGAQVGLDDVQVEGVGKVDLSWLSEDPLTGTVPPGASRVVNVTLDAGDVSAGQHNAMLQVFSNDPLQPESTVPVAMIVILNLNRKVYLPLVLRGFPP